MFCFCSIFCRRCLWTGANGRRTRRSWIIAIVSEITGLRVRKVCYIHFGLICAIRLRLHKLQKSSRHYTLRTAKHVMPVRSCWFHRNGRSRQIITLSQLVSFFSCQRMSTTWLGHAWSMAMKASRGGSGHAGSSARNGDEMLIINIIKMQLIKCFISIV